MTRAFITLTVLLQAFLGQACFIGTTYAAENHESPAPFSHEVPMSFNVVRCSWVQTDDGWEPTPDSPCASGHCVKQTTPDASCVFHANPTHLVTHVAVPSTAFFLHSTQAHDITVLPTHHPPPIIAASVVLRL